MEFNASEMIVPQEVKELTELLAENIHDKWMEQRLAEGWTFGPDRNDERKTHPGLVPYQHLSEGEKEYDRITAMATIRFILALGFQIERKGYVPHEEIGEDERRALSEPALEGDVGRTERFEIAFNHIHLLLKSLTQAEHDATSFVSLVNQLMRKHALIAKYAGKLKQYAKLRNALVHEFYGRGQYIAVPNMDVVEDIEQIQHQLSAPPKALSIASKRVLHMNERDRIIDIMQQMDTYQCTSVPIYNGRSFSGLLTEDGINRWLVHQLRSTSHVEFEGVRAREVLDHELKSNIVFMPKKTNVFEIEDLFEQKMRRKQKIDAVLITEDGRENQYPLGIITSWDLIKID